MNHGHATITQGLQGKYRFSLVSSAKALVILALLLIPVLLGLDFIDKQAKTRELRFVRMDSSFGVSGASVALPFLDFVKSQDEPFLNPNAGIVKEDKGELESLIPGADLPTNENEGAQTEAIDVESSLLSADTTPGAQVVNVELITTNDPLSTNEISLKNESNVIVQVPTIEKEAVAQSSVVVALAPTVEPQAPAPVSSLINREPIFEVQSPGGGGGFSGGGGGGGGSSAPAPTPPPPAPDPEPTTPSAPLSLVAERGDGEATLSWTAPASDGGATVSDYLVRFSTDNFTVDDLLFDDGVGVDLATTVTTLTNGVEYFFKIFAVNSAGTGEASSIVSATPAGPPGAVSDLVATAGDEAATLTWTIPSENGTAITGYELFLSADNFTSTTTFAGVIDPVDTTITGLTNGIEYSFKLFAANAVGTSTVSNVPTATPVAPATVPTTITDLDGEDNETDGEVFLFWTAPDDGGSAITSYDILYSDNDFVATSTFAGVIDPAGTTVDGLTNDTPYKFKVRAENAVGKSEESNILELTPTEDAAPPPF
ncbi:MAG: hypothetical protein COV10_03230 [Candidatus Vogelbacteria bacterium CG10_big_fil_rev_8_21_14_0_10_51_16]|uniref:Fibronectin type-III domain-containing protein n=1 Tax=Candidatus Vogelbacteria bacterium CG10_big_fil_rev_8_21_14_0_10_51_16 TaxID=1975045 RepID=A0A2H0RE14_9BACT|nr:MAG: hypothetical protein COV10_03230 [Candidatus Vogelbacteria bacterium CG10_big_fil_rev_8_21_14_0_10_51_16]